jgi:NAD(P)-dependent dehydrogenase (short-subunit alcohol dehydrogenase family)
MTSYIWPWCSAASAIARHRSHCAAGAAGAIVMHAPILQELFSLNGRVALVTGASGGIGAALAEGLAAAGAAVALSGRNEARLDSLAQSIHAAGGSAATFAADLDEPEAGARLAAAVADTLGPIGILVNCAGRNRRQPIAAVSPAVYEEIMSTNLRGLYFLSQAVLPQLMDQGGGKVINIGSLTSAIGLADVSVYGMTKAALAQLTRTMAIEWAEHNIQVNCLCPGFIATELTAPLWSDPQRSRWMLDRLPIKRAGKPADLLGMAIYLASRASDYTTGQTFFVDGGFLAGSQW